MERRRNNGPTPHGGAYSEVFYMDEDRNIVDESVATNAVIRECTEDGKLIAETWMKVQKPNGK